MPRARFLSVGESAISVELGQSIDEEVNARVHLLAARVRRSLVDEVQEVVPTYRSLLLVFDPLRVPRARLVARVERLVAALPAHAAGRRGRLVHVPVSYGGEFGPDLAFVAEHHRLGEDEVVSLHSSIDYRVYMLGFTPGFPYLGGMSPRIAAPRLDQPRPRIPAGTVGIAGEQTGIYPVESPGGWRLIGRTPLRLFDPTSRMPFLLSAGDRLRFRPVGAAEFGALEQRVAQGTYSPEIEDADGA
ncbi:MAG TPA: 5-oxoprolinase subunit PxpB [Anaeromyxobacteraceae bacterium]|nr:5-oxoprolinase subunit PxpB [Anaeromyxobacteraceae bacterium]